MGYKVTIEQGQLEFSVDAQENLLNAALKARINLPHGCKSGSCGACKCKVTHGEIELEEYNKIALSDDEVANNYVLLCKAHANSDVTLDLPGFTNGFPIKTMPSKIESIDKIGSVAIFKLKLPANQIFEFYPGQYIDIAYEGKNRSYSIANSPTTKGIIELHIRYRQGGVFSEAAWHTLATNQILRFKGPMGNFTLQNTNNPILMVCTGTGFAPLKAIIEQMVAENSQREIHLIWGNFTAEDFYLTEILPIWQNQLNLKVTLCTNNQTEGYYTGMVTDYIQETFNDLSLHEVYACGNPAMIENLYNIASSQLKLDKRNFYSDVFTPSI